MNQIEELPRSLSRMHCAWSLLLLTVACLQPVKAQAHDEGLKERFLREAPARWEEYLRHANKLQGRYSADFAASMNNLKSQTEVEFRANRRAHLIRYRTRQDVGGKKNYTEELFCVNSRYGFCLRRKSPGADWAVTQLEMLGNGTPPASITKRLGQHTETMAFPVRVHNQLLTQVIGKPYFRVVRCQAVYQGREELVEVAFESTHDVDQTTKDLIQGGTMLLDPKRFWCLRSYDVQSRISNAAGTMKFRLIDPSEPGDTLPLAKRFHIVHDWTFNQSVDKYSGNKQEWRMEMGDLREPDHVLGDEDFTLSAFGFPEPLGVTWSKPPPWYLWLGLGGGLCLALGGVFRWLKKRAATAAAAP